ncbi:pro-resilin-like [Cherax quadricarinatus]|uniref:pro-resilin-like n=1 Tax=Cherax quadricarinatus TaxID=27406 RepID=UPI00387E6353
MSHKVLLVLLLLCVLLGCVAAESGGYGRPARGQEHYAAIPYDFGYGVADHGTGNDFGHSENSDGNVVKGKYYVRLPDGRKQVVTYIADHYNGYQAQVTYEGYASSASTRY